MNAVAIGWNWKKEVSCLDVSHAVDSSGSGLGINI